MADWAAGQAIAGLGRALGVGALLGWYFQETLKQLLPTPRRIARWWRMWRGEVPRAKGTHFTILIADLDRDDDGSQTRHVEAALREHRGLDVLLVGQGPPSFDLGSRAEAQIESERRGRALLEQHNGDVLISGEVAQANTRLRLRFLAGHPGVEGRHGSYQLQAAELPADFGADFNAVLLALVATSIAPATEQAGTYLVDLLRPAAGKLQQLLAHSRPASIATSVRVWRIPLPLRHRCSEGRPARASGWSRQSPPTARPSRRGPASASRSTGR